MSQNYFHSVILEPEKCVGCTSCLKSCPTEAIRLKNGKASIIGRRCIDCGECIRICPNHAKNAVTDKMSILKKYKYNIAITIPVLYSQFSLNTSPDNILSSFKSIGFDEAYDTSIGSEIVNMLANTIICNAKSKPVINSSCPAVLRLIQVRFPELLDNVLKIITPSEITARLVKKDAIERTGLSDSDIGITIITPCTARATSIKKPLGIKSSCINNAVSIKDIYALLLKTIGKDKTAFCSSTSLNRTGLMWNTEGGQASSIEGSTLYVSGVDNAISALEEIELGRFHDLSYIEIMACPEGCLGGPLTVENRYVALDRMKHICESLDERQPSIDVQKNYKELYDAGSFKFDRDIKPIDASSLDSDILKSMEKMDAIHELANTLPGINCGICGSPTCMAFAEDVVTKNRTDSICPVNEMQKLKNINKTQEAHNDCK